MALACVAADGDMAITRYNAVSNLLADCLSGRIDVFAHVRPPLPCFTRPVPSSCPEVALLLDVARGFPKGK
eukprot:COSAG01_NODE_16017_length_1278_cov_1.408821_3_plen_70_part_01